jgi:putative transposase
LPLLGTARRRDIFLRALEAVRRQYRFLVVGYVVMPEHVHLLVSEPERSNLSVVFKALKQAVARRVLGSHSPDEQKRLVWGTPVLGTPVLGTPVLGTPVVGGTPVRCFWQARFYDFNVWTAKKRIEKLRYIHRNPVTRGLVASPEEWRWSSFRAYAFGEKGVVAVNAMFPPKWSVHKD